MPYNFVATLIRLKIITLSKFANMRILIPGKQKCFSFWRLCPPVLLLGPCPLDPTGYYSSIAAAAWLFATICYLY